MNSGRERSSEFPILFFLPLISLSTTTQLYLISKSPVKLSPKRTMMCGVELR